MTPLMDVTEVAHVLRISTKTVRRRVNDGSLPHHRIGRHLRFTPEDVETYLHDTYRGRNTRAHTPTPAPIDRALRPVGGRRRPA